MKPLRNLLVVVFLFSAALPTGQLGAKADVRAATSVVLSTTTTTQCAMCRAVLESEDDNSTAKGINNGIKYLMIIPYILVGGVFYFIYKSNKKTPEDSAVEQ